MDDVLRGACPIGHGQRQRVQGGGCGLSGLGFSDPGCLTCFLSWLLARMMSASLKVRSSSDLGEEEGGGERVKG